MYYNGIDCGVRFQTESVVCQFVGNQSVESDGGGIFSQTLCDRYFLIVIFVSGYRPLEVT